MHVLFCTFRTNKYISFTSRAAGQIDVNDYDSDSSTSSSRSRTSQGSCSRRNDHNFARTDLLPLHQQSVGRRIVVVVQHGAAAESTEDKAVVLTEHRSPLMH